MSKARHRCPCQSANAIARGFFYDDEKKKTVWGRMSVSGEDVEAQIKRSSFHKQQRLLDVSNRIFWLSKHGVVHVCTCKMAKADRDKKIAAAKRLVDSVFSKNEDLSA